MSNEIRRNLVRELSPDFCISFSTKNLIYDYVAAGFPHFLFKMQVVTLITCPQLHPMIIPILIADELNFCADQVTRCLNRRAKRLKLFMRRKIYRRRQEASTFRPRRSQRRRNIIAAESMWPVLLSRPLYREDLDAQQNKTLSARSCNKPLLNQWVNYPILQSFITSFCSMFSELARQSS